MDTSDPHRPRRTRLAPDTLRDLRGGARLAVDGLRAAIDRAETVHGRLAEVSPPVRGVSPGRPGRGWPALVWRGLRSGTDLLGGGLDLALATVQAALQDPQRGRLERTEDPSRLALLAGLNGAVGDHLHRTDNPLALPTRLHARGEPQPLVLLLVHDLGLSDLDWQRQGHDHGRALGTALGATPLYARYNSGRHVWATGRELAAELEARLGIWPVPLQGLHAIGHGLGGLVLRSALHQAVRAGQAWPAHLRQLVFLGTPLAGTDPAQRLPLHGLGALPGVASLTGRASDGLRDFREGRHLELPLPDDAWLLPPAAQAGALAGSSDGLGDGVVPLASALGRALPLDEARRVTLPGIDHLGLLASEAAHQQMRRWMAA